jgi:hypothetical protein
LHHDHLQLAPYPVPTSIGAIDYACALAKLVEAKLKVSSSRIAIHAPPNRIVGAMMSTMAREPETIANTTTQALEFHVMNQSHVPWITLKLSCMDEHGSGGVKDNAWLRRASGLCIPRPSPGGADPRLYVKDWLFGSGRPCIPYRNSSMQSLSAESIPLCLDVSRSTARTISDALPLLPNAKRVRVAVFRGGKVILVADPMTPAVVFPANHGVKVEAEEVAIGRRTIGHSRLLEFLLGGATRKLLAKCSMPLFMSHRHSVQPR